MKKNKKIEKKYTCLKCGQERLVNSTEDIIFFFCINCQERTKHRRNKGQIIQDYKTLKKDFEFIIEELRDVLKTASYQLSKVQDLSELVETAKRLENKIDKQYCDLIHSLNEEVVK